MTRNIKSYKMNEYFENTTQQAINEQKRVKINKPMKKRVVLVNSIIYIPD